MIRRLITLSLLLCLLLSMTPVTPGGSSPRPQTPNKKINERSWLKTLGTYTAWRDWVLNKISSAPKPPAESDAPPVKAFLDPAPFFVDAPTNLTVTATSDTVVSLSWTAAAGGVDHYQVESSQSISGPFMPLANTTATSFNDTTVSTDHAYLYRVRTIATGGAISTPGNMVLGTATTFQFTSLTGQEIKAQHFYDVRTAINAVRFLAGQPVSTWKRETLAGLTVEVDDVQEMRDRLNEALLVLSIAVTSYQDATLVVNSTPIKAVHIEELQTRSTRGSSSSIGPLDYDSATARLDPLNVVGGGSENPLSRNFNWTLPLVTLPGRAGLDLSLTLAYNSLAWTRSGNYIIFDSDRGFPSPGFRLGFPVIQPQYYNSDVGKSAFLLIGTDGTRTELRQVNTSQLYEAADSSHLLLDTSTLASTGSMTLTSPDGGQMKYSFVFDGYQCTEIRDSNGNYITVNYTSFGRIDTITDTANRTIKFNYNPTDNSLTSITQAWAGQPQHAWATFGYDTPQVNTNFSGLTVVGPANNHPVKVLKSVTLGDNSRYEFEHTNWLQVRKITSFGIDGHVLNYRSYNLPTDTGIQTDCPRFTERRDWAENWNRTGSNGPADVPNGTEAEVLTRSWAIPTSGSWDLPGGGSQTGVIAQVTRSDGAYDKIYYEGLAGTNTGWRRSLPSMIETYGSSNPSQNAPISKQKSSVMTWNQDLTTVTYPLNPRIEETNVYDFTSAGEILNRARTTISYDTVTIGDGTDCKLPSNVIHYQADASTPLRRTNTTYQNTTVYLSKRILGLPSVQSLYEVNPATQAETLVSKLSIDYDEAGSIIGSDTPVQHDNSVITVRGNPSTIKRYDTTPNSSAYLASTLFYNNSGSVVKTIDPAGHQVQISYADQFYGDGVTADAARSFVTLAYPTTVTDPDNFTTKNRFNYDFGAATWKQTPQPNTASNLDGPQQQFTFDTAGRLQRVKNLVNNAYTRYVYGPNYVEVFASTNTVNDEKHSLSIFDGMGRTIASAQNDPNTETAGYNGSVVVFDIMGRAAKESAPVETSLSITGVPINPYGWSASGADATTNNGFGWQYVSRDFDWKGRTLSTTNIDGTTTEISYEGCGCAGAEVSTLTDEGTTINGVNQKRQQKMYKDVIGRLVKTEVWNFDGTGSGGAGRQLYSTRVTTYNALDQPKLIRDFTGAATSDESCPTGTCQHTDLTYDGYGRLKTRHLPIQQATSGVTTDHTTWEYNADDTIHSITDARGVVTTYGYNNRHLQTSISYNTTGTANVASTTNVACAYDAAGNRTSMTDAAGTVSYHYDLLSRMDWEERTFANRPTDGAYRLSYQYNISGLLTRVLDEHSQRGFRQTYDEVARLTGVFAINPQGTETQYSAQMKYRATGALKSMAFAGSTLSKTYNQRGTVASLSSTGLTRSYQYHNDGQIKFVDDQSASGGVVLDRGYSYDFAGRLKEAFSGTQAFNYANNIPGGTANGPYYQNYTYDPWNNETAVNSRLWSRDNSMAVSAYADNRQATWNYDNDGRLVTMNEPLDAGMALPYAPLAYTYDAAGREALSTQTRTQVNQNFITNEFHNSSVYDGSDQLMSFANSRDVRFHGTVTATITDAGYYLRSTILDGNVISQYQDGVLVHNYIYAATERIGENSQDTNGNPINNWFHVDPVTGDTVTANLSGTVERAFLDPQGVSVGDSDPFPPDGTGDLDGLPDPSLSTRTPLMLAIDGGAKCLVNGILTPCWTVSSEAVTQCPNGDCGARWNPRVKNYRGSNGAFEFFRSFANGYSGWMTSYGLVHYEGGSSYYRSAYEQDHEFRSYLNRTPATSFGGLGMGLTTLQPQKSLCDHLVDQLWTLFKSHADEVGGNVPGPRNGKKVTDCFIYARNVLTYAYEQAGRKDIADAIRKIPDEAGVELAKYLHGQGWSSYYYNPDVKNPRLPESEHPVSYQNAQKTGQYYGIPVDNYVINYNMTNPKQANDMTGYASFNSVRFAFGVAHGGTHNFMYSTGMTFEVHWDQPDNSKLYERRAFYTWPWLSGLMLVPPDCK